MASRGDFGASSRGAYGSVSVSYHLGPIAKEKDNFNNLCDSISGKIFSIRKNVSKLEEISLNDEELVKKHTESRIHMLSQETNKLANETKEAFKQVSEYTRVGRYEQTDHRQKQFNIHQEKLRGEFENTLSRYQSIQNVLSMRMKERIEQETNSSQDPSLLINISHEEDEKLEDQSQTAQTLSHQQELEYVKERHERIKQIESDMLNVNDIFRDLALLVHEQGATIDSIESNIEHAAVHVEDANTQLERAKNYQKSARKRLCCIALISLIVAAVLALIIYYSVK